MIHSKKRNLDSILNSLKAHSPATIDGRNALDKAIEYYDNYLAIVKAINDRVLMGRAYGNLGNAHYRLGSFETAIECHMERSVNRIPDTFHIITLG